MFDRRAQWKFLITEDGSWYWEVERPGTERRKSTRHFATLAECALDARHEGYVTCLELPDRRDTQHAASLVKVVVAHETPVEAIDAAKRH